MGNRQIEIGQEGEMISIPLSEYEELLNIVLLEKKLTKMFDSDIRVGLSLLDEIRKIKTQK